MGLATAGCTPGPRSTLYLCDWLPPDYGAVGQYSLLFSRQRAATGERVILIGFSSSGESTVEMTSVGAGELTLVRIACAPYDKTRFWQRMLWTLKANTRLLGVAMRHAREADEIVFTGSPPLFLHWIAAANVVLRKRLVYRITDFHPECLMAEKARPSLALRLLYRLTLFWRRRIDRFEALGHDQIERLAEIGIPRSRIVLKPDPSPVVIAPGVQPLERPSVGSGQRLLLYSGNWGVAHDTATFLEAYRRHHAEGGRRAVLWLNAVGAAVEGLSSALSSAGLPFVRTYPVPLEQLASLLVTPDAHLITLKDEFVGFVLPSKVHGCIASGLPVLYIGSDRSDVHRLCRDTMSAPYRRVGVGDVAACAEALDAI